MNDMCTGCLSTDRKLFFIGETGYYHLYSQILNEIPVYDLSQVCVRICWECRARLRSMQLFRQQVKQNYCDLMQQIPPQATSCLSSCTVHNMSYPDVKSDFVDGLLSETTPMLGPFCVITNVKTVDEIVVKCESVEHCEPEPFANAISVDQVMGPERDDTSEIKTLKKKKKPKIKLKSTKIKVKKKCKKKFKENLTEDSNIEESTDHVDIDNNIDDNIDENIEANIDDNIEANIDENIEANIEESNLNKSFVKADKKVTNVSSEKVKKVSNVVSVKRLRASTPPAERPQCQECGKVFSSKKTYRYHLNVLHKGQNQYPCPRCGKVYQWKSNLGRHMRSHRAVDDGELHCTLCDKSFASVATYRQHLRISRRHVPETEFTFACDACGKRFVNKTRLRDHVDWEHLNRIKFRCQLCDKPFKCHTSLYVHTQNVHVGRERRDNLCHVCGKSYQNAAKLKYHITAMHSGETPYRCAVCGAAFGWYSSLYRHMREVHHKLKGVPKKGKKLKQSRASPAPAPHYAPLALLDGH